MLKFTTNASKMRCKFDIYDFIFLQSPPSRETPRCLVVTWLIYFGSGAGLGGGALGRGGRLHAARRPALPGARLPAARHRVAPRVR